MVDCNEPEDIKASTNNFLDQLFQCVSLTLHDTGFYKLIMSSFLKHKLNMQPDLQEAWRDVSVTRARVGELVEQSKINSDLGLAQADFQELELKTANFERLLGEMQAPMRAILNSSFPGTAEWRHAFGVKVGAPPIPGYITADFFKSDCPLHPGRAIKDTHIVMLLPKAVDGKPYSARKLKELCAVRKESQWGLIDAYANKWEQGAWTSGS